MTFQQVYQQTTEWYHGTISNHLDSLKKGIKVDYRPRNCDFGIGFYLTANKAQALKWAKRKAEIEKDFNPNVRAIILTYELPKGLVYDTKIFEANSEFLDFIYLNRVKLDHQPETNLHSHSLVFGPVIDGVISTLKDELESFRTTPEKLESTLNMLLGKYKKDNQLCICNQQVADKMILKEIKEDI